MPLRKNVNRPSYHFTRDIILSLERWKLTAARTEDEWVLVIALC